MKLPKNMKLPFFAYGLFKPGQLCYFRIKDLVEDHYETGVLGSLYERDGIPILKICENCSKIKGSLLKLDSGKEKQAYELITEIEPKNLYWWNEVYTMHGKANVLVGKSTLKGSFPLEDTYEYDGRNDPYFKEALEEVKSIISKSHFAWDNKHFFRLQMAYMLLWTSIERYASLKYGLGKDVNEKIQEISNELIFKTSLKKHVKDAPRFVHSALNLKKYTLDPNDPNNSINYYYQVRSNSVHRGKAFVKDFDIIESSLKELLAIFKDMLDESWNIDKKRY